MGFIHECCWLSLILQMDWCPLWGLNTKRPVLELIIQLSPHYTVYKSLMLSVCKFAVILLCSLVNLIHKVQKANHTIDIVQTITFYLICFLSLQCQCYSHRQKLFQIKCQYVTYLGLYFCIDNCFLKGEMKIYRPVEIIQHTTVQLEACNEFRSRVSTPFDHFVITGEIILLRLTRNGCLRGR